MYEINSDKELTGYFRTTENDNGIGSHNKEHIPRLKGRPVKKKNKNKPFSPTGKGTYLKATQNKETNKEEKYETMNTSYDKKEDEDEGMTLEYEPSTPDPTNTDQVIDNYDETETTEKLQEDYYEAKIDHNHPNNHIIWELVK